MEQYLEYFSGPPLTVLKEAKDLEALTSKGEVKAILWSQGRETQEFLAYEAPDPYNPYNPYKPNSGL